MSVVFPDKRANPTKREVLGKLARVYDPLGLVSPMTLQGKLIFREACESKTPWDAALPEKLAKLWEKWESSLPARVATRRSLATIREPVDAVELHAFGDASGRGVATAVYAVVSQASGVTQGLVAAKSRLAKQGLTIPRLELVGDCKKLELDDLCVRWYMKNKSLTINGEGSEDLKSQLKAAVCVAESDAAASQQPECESVLLSYTLGNPATQSPAVSASVLELVQSLEERLECKLEKLASQIEELSSASLQQLNHEPNDASQSTEYSAFLKSENTSLKKQNMVLAEQVNGFKMMISDLKTKIKDLDNEKNSLVTTIKILQEGQKCEENGPLNAFKRQSANSPAIKNNSSRAVCTSGIQTQNRYSILSETDNDGEDTLTSQKRFESGITPVAKDTVSVTKNSGTENSKDTDYRSSEIVLIGDSIIKHIDPKKLAKRKVSKYAYPGEP